MTQCSGELIRQNGRPTVVEAVRVCRQCCSNAIAICLRSGQPVGPRTYEVNIRADPAQMLDWDKPLTEQQVAIAFRRQSAVKQRFVIDAHDLEDNPTGHRGTYGRTSTDVEQSSRRHDSIQSMIGCEQGRKLVQATAEAGIPGIKYLDQGSRARHPTQMQADAGRESGCRMIIAATTIQRDAHALEI